MQFNSEKELFKYVRDTRPHICEISGKPIREAQAWCFAHILGKGMNPKYRLYPNNIMLVYGLTEHREVDKLASGKKYVLEQYIKEGKK